MSEQVMESISSGQDLSARKVCDRVLVHPRRHCYSQGEQVRADVFGLDGHPLGEERFRIGFSPGSGFGGQVYQAQPLEGVIDVPGMDGAAAPVALKILVPQATRKRVFRDLLFRLSYQTSFAPRLRLEALRCGLIWQELVRTAASLEFGTESLVARPYGYFWDARLASYVEIHQWIEGRPVRYEVDDRLLLRWLGSTVEIFDSEISRKQACMAALVKLCQNMGALGLARQYEWYTLVSQVNLLTRISRCDGQGEFTGVDWRPGLAVPFFLPLSPVHARMIWQGLFRGVYTHYDEVDFKRLEVYVRTHADAFEPLAALIRQLKEDDACYRAGLPDLWNAPDRLLRQADGRRQVRKAAINDWCRLGRVSKNEAAHLHTGRGRFYSYLLLDNIPLVGGAMMRWMGNEDYRQHVHRFLSDETYRKQTLVNQRSSDLLDWQARGRISLEHKDQLANSMNTYLMDKIVWSWLPAGLHRYATDPCKRKQVMQGLTVQPLRLLVDSSFRQSWLDQVLTHQMHKGILSLEQVENLRAQVKEQRMQGFLRDLGLTIGLEFFAKLLYLILAVYGLRTRNFLPLGMAALGPIAPSGIVRAIYVLAQLIIGLPAILITRDNKLFWTRILGLTTAPWRFVGNLFAPLEMFAYYNEMSLVLGDYLVSKMVSMVPVLGGRGKVLEYWAFNLTYNLPLSLRKMVEEKLIGRNART